MHCIAFIHADDCNIKRFYLINFLLLKLFGFDLMTIKMFASLMQFTKLVEDSFASILVLLINNL